MAAGVGRIRDIVDHYCATLGVRGDLRYERRYPATVNTLEEALLARTPLPA